MKIMFYKDYFSLIHELRANCWREIYGSVTNMNSRVPNHFYLNIYKSIIQLTESYSNVYVSR